MDNAFPSPHGADAEQVTLLLQRLGQGQADAAAVLLPIIYDELRALAHQKLDFERDGHTLNTTALVHEAYLRLAGQHVTWQNRTHFYAIAAQAMRRILVNYAAQRNAAKRGGRQQPLPLDVLGHDVAGPGRSEDLVALDEALQRLAAFNERGARVVEYRFFGGMTYEEIAGVLGVSVITVRRAWMAAKAWLHRELSAA